MRWIWSVMFTGTPLQRTTRFELRLLVTVVGNKKFIPRQRLDRLWNMPTVKPWEQFADFTIHLVTKTILCHSMPAYKLMSSVSCGNKTYNLLQHYSIINFKWKFKLLTFNTPQTLPSSYLELIDIFKCSHGYNTSCVFNYLTATVRSQF